MNIWVWVGTCLAVYLVGSLLLAFLDVALESRGIYWPVMRLAGTASLAAGVVVATIVVRRRRQADGRDTPG
jgi:hypothetical protein